MGLPVCSDLSAPTHVPRVFMVSLFQLAGTKRLIPQLFKMSFNSWDIF